MRKWGTMAIPMYFELKFGQTNNLGCFSFVCSFGGGVSFLLSLFHGREGSGERPISHNIFHLKRKRVFSPPPHLQPQKKHTTLDQLIYQFILLRWMTHARNLAWIDRYSCWLQKLRNINMLNVDPHRVMGKSSCPLVCMQSGQWEIYSLHLINTLKDKRRFTLNNGLGHGLWNLIVPQLLDETMTKPMMSHGPRAFCSRFFSNFTFQINTK
jgi:hypothetical protein